MEKTRTSTAAITRNATDAAHLPATDGDHLQMANRWVTDRLRLPWIAMAGHRLRPMDAALLRPRAGDLSRAVDEARY